tara:strand:+ start:12457 stop:14688 length:2232 start_codon:yes stop_codon:yes gene_type:complete
LNFKHIKSDFVGGVISALVSLPLALACGILVFKGIDGMQQFGINAAFYSAIIGGLVSVFIGNHSLQIGGPLVVTALILSDFLKTVYEKLGSGIEQNQITLLVLMIVCVVFTGVIQYLFAYLKLGRLIKFLPLSVTMGISTTIGIIIIVKQLPIVFNSTNSNTSETLLLLFITLFVLVLLFLKEFIPNKEKIIEKLNFNPFILFPVIVPILAGIIFFIFSNNKDLLLGNVNVEIPNLKQNFDFIINSQEKIYKFFPQLILASFSIALMSSLSSLLSVSLLERRIKNRSEDSAIELKGQATGNILSGLFGGMSTAGTEARSLVNYYAGGRTSLSVLINCLTIFLVIFIFKDLMSFIPEIILSAMLIYTGIVMSLPTLKLGKNFLQICSKKDKKEKCVKDIVYTFTIIVVMLTTAFITDITIAIVFGFAVASIFFIYEMMRNSNYTIINRSVVSSKRERPFKAREILQKNGSLISIIELDGAIFFGTADSLKTSISSIKNSSKWIILDFKKVTEIDITGAEIIKSSIEENKNIIFVLSHIRKGDDTYQALCSVGLISENGLSWHEYTDFALEETENYLLKEFGFATYLNDSEYKLEDLSVTRNLEIYEQNILLEYLEEKSFKKGEYLYKEGEDSNKLFFLRKGSVSIWDEHEEELYRSSSISKTRRITFSPGVVVGQMGFFENTIHSVEAIADDDLKTYILSKDNFEKLLKEHSLLGQDLMLEFCKHLSKRLREVTYEVQVLERWN